ACGQPALVLTDTNGLAGAAGFCEAARKLGVRALVGASLRRDRQRATVLIGEPAGYRSLCRLIIPLHCGQPAALPPLLAERAEGLHLLCDDPNLFKPPLTEAFKGLQPPSSAPPAPDPRPSRKRSGCRTSVPT